jgi:hypothetical protein
MVPMKTVTTLKNQTIFDLAVQEYGNVAAWEEIISLNPDLRNDYSTALDAGITYYPDEFDVAFPLLEAQEVTVDDESGLINRNYLRELGSRQVISFDDID